MPRMGEHEYPGSAALLSDEFELLAGDVLTYGITASQAYNMVNKHSSVADGDSAARRFYLAAGTYNLSVLGRTFTTSGLVDWYIDGVKVVSLQDWYDNPGAYNVVKTASVVVPTSGRHVLKYVVNGKNGASSSYTFLWTKCWFSVSGVG